MKKILLFITIISMCLCSCIEKDYTDWETSVKYHLICGEDTISFEDIDTISEHNMFMPVAITTSDSSAIIVRFMNNDGESPKYERTYNYRTKIKNKIVYQHCIPKLNSKLELIEFNKRIIRYKRVSKFDGEEIVPDTNMTFVPVI